MIQGNRTFSSMRAGPAMLSVLVFAFYACGLPPDSGNPWDQAPHLILSEPDQSISSVDFSPDGQYLVAAGNEGTIWIWDTSTGQLIHDYAIHDKATYVRQASFESKDVVLSCGDDGTIRIYDFRTKAERLVIREPSEIYGISIIPDLSWVVSEGASIKIWSTTTGALIQTVAKGIQTRQVVASESGRFIVAARYDGQVQLWDREGNEEEIVKNDADNWCAAISETRKAVYVASDKGGIQVFSLSPLEHLASLPTKTGHIPSIDLSESGECLVWCTNQKNDVNTAEVIMWDLSANSAVWRSSCNDSFLTSVSVSADSKMIAVAGEFGGRILPDHAIYVWKTNQP